MITFLNVKVNRQAQSQRGKFRREKVNFFWNVARVGEEEHINQFSANKTPA